MKELKENKFFDQWLLASDQQNLLVLLLAGEISRKRGGKFQQFLGDLSKLPDSIINQVTAKMYQKQLEAQDEVAQYFFEQAKKQQTLSTQSFTYNPNTKAIIATSPITQTKMDQADDLNRLANLISSTMIGKLQKGLLGERLPKNNSWVVDVATNFKFSNNQ
jgi:hypothetical protein